MENVWAACGAGPDRPGPHAVTVPAWDSADNVGAAALNLRTPGK